MAETSDYLALIPPLHAGQPNFVATVGFSVDPLARIQSALFALIDDFDLDDAIGVQLDAVGVRVGLSRLVPYALQGLFFSWGDPIRGWGAGVWKGRYDVGTSLYSLDDDTYRRLLFAKILANTWDGTVEGEEGIYNAYFTDQATLVFVSDDSYSAQPKEFFTWGDPNRGWGRGTWVPADANLNDPSLSSVDMKMTVGFAGKIPQVIDLAILNEGLVGAKPEGVTVDIAVTSVDGAPLFGFGMDNEFITGWGGGAWAVKPADLIGQSAQLIVPGTLDFSLAENSGLLGLL
ncbi:DUF2612 domain-containing protein [Beijerinckia sp. L45]|uniref:DUF2612 domain-containing protein n=1 Tax=Beijerinckia sp. L45 TaxID=1641855 RepID=UPI00131A8A48|nr:DUF2612 domain-containing protein [Beijerinckia sp. L45]